MKNSRGSGWTPVTIRPQKICVSKCCFPPQAEVLSCNQRYLWGGADGESGSLGFRGAFAEVVLQLLEVSHFPRGGTVCAGSARVVSELRGFSRLYWVCGAPHAGTQGHSQQNVLYVRYHSSYFFIYYFFVKVTSVPRRKPLLHSGFL